MADERNPDPMEAEIDEDESAESDEMDEDENDEESTEAVKPEVYLPGKALKKGEELVPDHTAYRMLHVAQTGAPCLSFDVIKDALGDSRTSYPMSMYLVAGTQAAQAHLNSILVVKMSKINGIKSDDDDDEDESDEELSDDEDESSAGKRPVMSVAAIRHQGCVNRVRCTQMGEETYVATWSELGKVHLWNLEEQLNALQDPKDLAQYKLNVDNARMGSRPVFTFKGHQTEGYALDWCPTETGTLVSGDCNGNIHLWRFAGGRTWLVDQRPYNSHAPSSVEDLQWSPNEKNVLASCSVDKSIKIWDTRVNPQSACMLTASNAHESDVNVISWNKKETRFIVSGGDDGFVKVWDLRQFGTSPTTPVASFKQHTKAVTTVEWHPDEATIFASGGEDDQIAQWDLSLEVDQSEDKQDNELAGLPPQLLFIHQGQKEIKELHWHPQCPGTILSTANSGFNVFRTISV